ncbi:Ppx/GppA phosphatase family protein [Pseudodesulfovibrio sediminis]|uniref:Ppx/GppA phosphatase N-terminal domain-containing protein n=1 Tax=Pseudodesulfovibrio sediminis TaxID=2810563 RepID=A0ABN6ER58_9BACT|nr:hypothetical protein [Pseudodesulfovibrio sediminis]BCS87915.1 hypothetical protein PSDVSF_11570 [Pseudodesulfovibrio sediminis]
MRLTFRYALFIGLIACLVFAQTCLAQSTVTVRRAAFDIGSASIKCTIADVDKQSGRIVTVLETLSEKVDFAEDMDRSYDSNLSSEVMEQGIMALERMKAIAIKLNALEYSAAGGAVFRSARNGRAYCVQIAESVGIPCRILSKQQAAMLSYHAVQQTMQQPDNNLVVWDIGAESMQMTTREQTGDLIFYIDPMASISFKNVIIKLIQKKNPTTVSTPNPMLPDEVEKARTYIQSHAVLSVPQQISSCLGQPEQYVVGIGGVHFYSVPEVLGINNSMYTRDQVAEALQEWTGKSDEEFESEYANTRLTNLILVLGYMDALGIDAVHPLKINQADGLLTAPEFW